ncbi:MAG: hypothetical protein DRQ47_05905 [Gammaproteobacteria bacterium]|nr:MAG: hypothetical protein DRQ47_05905 [Gammaproteobacteria bacterium]
MPIKEVIVSRPEPKPSLKPELKQESNKISELERAALKNIADLNYNYQSQIPDMDFSTHIYVNDGGSFVIINGKSISDGGYISRGLKVVEITARGVILEFKDRRFFLSSMVSWQGN